MNARHPPNQVVVEFSSDERLFVLESSFFTLCLPRVRDRIENFRPNIIQSVVPSTRNIHDASGHRGPTFTNTFQSNLPPGAPGERLFSTAVYANVTDTAVLPCDFDLGVRIPEKNSDINPNKVLQYFYTFCLRYGFPSGNNYSSPYFIV